eukprot:TRINITY_DN1850_c0_g1_i2.p1 TRINITY_DN1850_c0_g1~~TRINITY_DN1850_c0_g1_i2.p1  ORF type:complete len:113 (-),score=35.68 TRINITY_DN1850_c0_g1_i2:51-341(-)
MPAMYPGAQLSTNDKDNDGDDSIICANYTQAPYWYQGSSCHVTTPWRGTDATPYFNHVHGEMNYVGWWLYHEEFATVVDDILNGVESSPFTISLLD